MSGGGNNPQSFDDWVKAFNGGGSTTPYEPIQSIPGLYFNRTTGEYKYDPTIAGLSGQQPLTAYQLAQLGIDQQRLSIEASNTDVARQRLAQDWATNQADNQARMEEGRNTNLASLIQNRNTNAVGLANAEGNIAKNAADFAAHPYDATADLMYRQAAGMNGSGGTPYGSTQNPQFGQLGNALGDKFQAIFGGTGADLARAREFIGSIPPEQYFPGGHYPAGPAAASAPAAQPESMANANPEQQAALRQMEANREMASATPDQQAALRQIDQQRQQAAASPTPQGATTPPTQMNIPGAGPMPQPFALGGTIQDPQGGSHMIGATTSEGGTNMNVPEPAKIVGIKSGHVYATMSEMDPEQLIIKPLPSVMKKRKELEQKQKDGQKALIAGAKRYDAGGTITYGQQPSDFINQLRSSLGTLGARSGAGQALPDPRLLAGDQAYEAFSNDKDFQGLTQAGYSSLGITPNTLDYTVSRYRPQAIMRTPRLI